MQSRYDTSTVESEPHRYGPDRTRSVSDTDITTMRYIMKNRIIKTPLVVAAVLAALSSGVGAVQASNSGSQSDDSTSTTVQDGNTGSNRDGRVGRGSQRGVGATSSTTVPGAGSQRDGEGGRRLGSSRTTTAPPPKPRTPERVAVLAQWRIQLDAYKDARAAIVETRNLAVSAARAAFVEARKAADTEELRRAARDAMKTSITRAQSEFKAALKVLGKPPVRPRLEAGTTTTTTTVVGQ
jgi:hypothetical protein